MHVTFFNKQSKVLVIEAEKFFKGLDPDLGSKESEKQRRSPKEGWQTARCKYYVAVEVVLNRQQQASNNNIAICPDLCRFSKHRLGG